jgi:hypothetical protein
MSPSGWCTAPAGYRPKHEDCRAAVCGCPCHEKKEKG